MEHHTNEAETATTPEVTPKQSAASSASTPNDAGAQEAAEPAAQAKTAPDPKRRSGAALPLMLAALATAAFLGAWLSDHPAAHSAREALHVPEPPEALKRLVASAVSPAASEGEQAAETARSAEETGEAHASPHAEPEHAASAPHAEANPAAVSPLSPFGHDAAPAAVSAASGISVPSAENTAAALERAERERYAAELERQLAEKEKIIFGLREESRRLQEGKTVAAEAAKTVSSRAETVRLAAAYLTETDASARAALLHQLTEASSDLRARVAAEGGLSGPVALTDQAFKRQFLAAYQEADNARLTAMRFDFLPLEAQEALAKQITVTKAAPHPLEAVRVAYEEGGEEAALLAAERVPESAAGKAFAAWRTDGARRIRFRSSVKTASETASRALFGSAGESAGGASALEQHHDVTPGFPAPNAQER